ncbi:MAG: Ig domain-containing protein [bacterium]
MKINKWNRYFPGLLVLLTMIVCGGGKKEEQPRTNTAPMIKQITILPTNPTLGSRIILRITAEDKEGDDINFTVNWFKNDVKTGEGIEFYVEDAKRGDKIYAEVTPDDGKLEGTRVLTDTVVVANAPPQIRSARISQDSILTSTDSISVIGDGFDPDGDSLRWVCYWTLNNSKRMADSSTSIKIKNFKLKKGDILTAELYAFDKDTVSNPYVLNIEIANSPPVLKEGLDSIPYKPESIYYQLPIVDPDGDEITFALLDAPYGIFIDKKKGIIYGKVAEATNFEVSVRATDTDGAYLDAKFTLTAPQKSSQ